MLSHSRVTPGVTQIDKLGYIFSFKNFSLLKSFFDLLIAEIMSWHYVWKGLYSEYGKYTRDAYKGSIGLFNDLIFYWWHRPDTIPNWRFVGIFMWMARRINKWSTSTLFFQLKSLLVTLNFLRQYPTHIELASRWFLSRPTVDLILEYVLNLINTNPALDVHKLCQ